MADRSYLNAGGGLLLMADDSEFDLTEMLDGILDNLAWALKVVDYAHSEIHDGRAFALSAYDDDLDTSDELIIAFTTPDTTRLCHLVAVPGNTSSSLFEILEGPTITAGTGSDLTPMNRYRDSANVSGVLSIKATPVANEATLGPTITNDGTVIWSDTMGVGKAKGGTSGKDREEWILARDTTYAFRITGLADNGLASLMLSWYEHVGR